MHDTSAHRWSRGRKGLRDRARSGGRQILDQVIVARRLGLVERRTPPFAADAFRPLAAGDVISHAAPAKTPRRSVGDKSRDFRRLGLRQKQQRTRLSSASGQAGSSPRVPRCRLRSGSRRVLGYGWRPARTAVRAAGRAARAAYRSRPRNVRRRRRAPGDQSPDKSVPLISICRAGIGSARVTARPIASKPKPASSRIVGCRQRCELQIEQPRHMRHVARRQREADVDGLDRAVDAIEAKPQGRARRHRRAPAHGRASASAGPPRATTASCVIDRLEQITQAVIDRRRDDRDERLVDAAERLVETPQKLAPQNARQMARAACR